MPEYKAMNVVLPEADTELRPYFVAAGEGRLVAKRCGDCSLLRYPPGVACTWCSSLSFDWADLSGEGTIYSYEIITQAIQPGFRDWVPYPLVLVELDEQRGVPAADEALRVIANLVTADLRPEAERNVAIGRRVRVVFQPLGDGLALPQFALSDQPPAAEPWQYQD